VNKLRRQPGHSEVTHVIGDVADRRAILIDDIIDTGGTTVGAAESILGYGATEVHAAATHPVSRDRRTSESRNPHKGGRRYRHPALEEG
jgi:ribose-phosphate pyrophosphokinase